MKLGIVGHGGGKFTEATKLMAIGIIAEEIRRHHPTHVVSGRSPLGGVDIWAIEVGKRLGCAPEEYPPVLNEHGYGHWDGPGGFRERNLKIAAASDLVLCVVVADYPPGYRWKKEDGCRHCGDRNLRHVKSGGCWTAWRAENRDWRIIE